MAAMTTDDVRRALGITDEQIAKLEGKKPKPVDVLQWVSNNLQGDPDMETCPGPGALALMLDCRTFPAFRIDFWKSMYTKLVPSRAQLGGDDDEGPIDGHLTIDLLAKITSIRNDAVNWVPEVEDEEE